MGEWQLLPGETPFDRSFLKIKQIRTRAQLNAAEAENIRKATVKYLAKKPSKRIAPFRIGWVKRLHKEMFCDVWRWAGSFRVNDEVNIGISFTQIETSVHALLENVRCWEQQQLPFLDQAAMLHHKAVLIHPFPNGNGRWARMLANIWLKQHGQAITKWPEEVIGTKSILRDTYLKAIRLADDGEYAPLADLHRQHADVPLDWLDGMNTGNAALTARARANSQPWPRNVGQATEPLLPP